MNISAIIIAAYLLLSVVICWAVDSRRKKSISSLFVAKRELNSYLLIPLLFAGMVGGTTVTSAASAGYSAGIVGISHVVGMAIGAGIFLIFVAKPYRILVAEKNVMSVPEAFHWFFDEKVKNLMIVVIALTNCMILATVPTSVGALLSPILGIEMETMRWIVWAIWIFVTLAGGLRGIAAMNIIHMGVMVVSLTMIMVKSLGMAGGIASLQTALSSSYFSMGSMGALTMVAMVAGAAIAQPTNTVISSAVFSGKSYKKSVTSIICSSLLLIPFGLIVVFIGMSAKVLLPEIAANAALSTVASLIGPVFAAMVSMAICAATISTAPASLLAVTNMFCINFYKPYINKNATEKQLKIFSYIFAIAVSILLTFVGKNGMSLLKQLTGAAQINSVSGIVMIIGLYWKKVDSNGVFWSMLIGTIVGTVWHILGSPFGIAVLWPAFFSVMIVLVLMTLFNGKSESDNHIRWMQIKKEYFEKHSEII